MNKDTFPKKALPLVPTFLASCALYTQFETWHSLAVCRPALFRAESRKLFQQAAGERTSLPPLLRVCEITQLSHLLLPGDVAMPDCLSLPCFRSHTIHQGRMAGRMCVELWVMALPREHLIFHLVAVAISPSSLPRQEVCLAEELTPRLNRRSHQCLLLRFPL